MQIVDGSTYRYNVPFITKERCSNKKYNLRYLPLWYTLYAKYTCTVYFLSTSYFCLCLSQQKHGQKKLRNIQIVRAAGMSEYTERQKDKFCLNSMNFRKQTFPLKKFSSINIIFAVSYIFFFFLLLFFIFYVGKSSFLTFSFLLRFSNTLIATIQVYTRLSSSYDFPDNLARQV